jgi:hypothetical protein
MSGSAQEAAIVAGRGEPARLLLRDEAMDELVSEIRRRIAAGTLPKDDCLFTWYRPGRGEPCAVCDRRILGTHLGIHCDTDDVGTIHLHEQCYSVWFRIIKGEPTGDELP